MMMWNYSALVSDFKNIDLLFGLHLFFPNIYQPKIYCLMAFAENVCLVFNLTLKTFSKFGCFSRSPDWTQDEFVHDSSVRNPHTSSSSSSFYTSFFCPLRQRNQTPFSSSSSSGSQLGGWHVPVCSCSAGVGVWASNIDSMSTIVEREEANGAFLTRLTLDQSHHTVSQGRVSLSFHPLPPPFFLFLSHICSFFHFYSVKGKRRKN